MEGLFRLFLLNQPHFDESAVRRNHAGNAWICNIVSQLSRVQNQSVQRYMRNHNIQHGFLNVLDILQALARWPNSKTWLLFQRIVSFAALNLVALAPPVAQGPAAPAPLVAQVPAAPAAPVAQGPAAPVAQILPINARALAAIRAIRAPIPIQWARDSYFTQDNNNFLWRNRLPFIIFIGIIDQGCVDIHYTTMYLRFKFIKKMHKRREILGSWRFIGNGYCFRLYRANLEVIFKFEGISENVVCTPADIGIDVQTCCSVCVEDVQPTEPMYLFECMHIFHKACIDQWKLAKHVDVTCPNCRALI